jgi:beta-lactamase superfamily II metal-dependent hydrolase
MKFQRFRLWARSRLPRALFALGIALASAPAPSSAQGLFARPTPKLVTVEVLDVGQGDSILIRSPEGKTALIDAGPTKDAAAKLLKSKGISTIDLVAVSHHHSDHYGGMEQIVRLYKPRYFLASNSGHTTKLYLKLLKAVEEEQITAIAPTAKPRKIELGSVELTIFPQPPDDSRNENNNSIGIRLRYGDFSVLLTGDSETSERKWWLRGHPELLRDCTILKLAHHGSHNGTDQQLLQLVKPELAVASLGKDNSYGHPHSETLALLKRNRIPLLRTDQVGTITIQSDGSNWKIAQPNLARKGKPTQDDVDRVAASPDDEEPRPSLRKTRRR